MGGSWEDPGYIFNTLFSKDPFNRDKYNGCRCVKSSDNNISLLKTVSNPSFNVINSKPVTDDVYNAYLSMFRYSKFNLELDNESPGRLGQYIGWQIVRAYANNNEVSFQDILTKKAEDIFNDSKFKPRK